MGCGCHRKYKKYYFDLHLMSSEIYSIPITFYLQVSRLFFLFFPSCLSSAFYFYFPHELPNFHPPATPQSKNRENSTLHRPKGCPNYRFRTNFYLQLKKIKRLVCQYPSQTPIPPLFPLFGRTFLSLALFLSLSLSQNNTPNHLPLLSQVTVPLSL